MDPKPIDDDLVLERNIAKKLKMTWDVFYARHGRMREVQRLAALPILAGENVLITSPTASGKTEAAVAPLIERLGSSQGPWMILYIIPTRALVNDLYNRLHQPCERINVSVVRRTGEYKSINSPPNILLTTPESFDSMMCRGRTRGGHLLLATRALVLDEIHLLADTGRGEQVRWLTERLHRLKNYGAEKGWVSQQDLQIVALSASLRDPQDIVSRFLGSGKVIATKGQRTIEVLAEEDTIRPVEVRLPLVLGGDQSDKVLLFCKARSRVDGLCKTLKRLLPGDYKVVGHHGALAKRIREETEETLKLGAKVVVVSTSTLEIGIDIGDIDIVALDEPAPDICSLLQRIGRGNRRTLRTRVLPCSRQPSDPLIHKAMLYCAENGNFGGKWGGTQFAAAIQQLASFIFQSPSNHRQREALLGLACAMLAQDLATEIVDGLIAGGVFEIDASGIRLNDALKAKADSGQIHSVIEDPPGLEVRDADTGALIATKVLAHGEKIVIAGLPLLVEAVKPGRIEVRQSGSDFDTKTIEYRPTKHGPNAGQPYAVRMYLNLADDVWPVMWTEEEIIVFHLKGFQVETVLELNKTDRAPCHITEFVLRYSISHSVNKPGWLNDIDKVETRARIFDQVESLEYQLARPYANQQLPRNLRAYELCSWLNVDDTVDVIKAAKFSANEGRIHHDVLIELL